MGPTIQTQRSGSNFKRNPIQPPQRADEVRKTADCRSMMQADPIGDRTRQYSPKKIPARIPAKPPMLTMTPRLGVFMDSFCCDLDRFEDAHASRDSYRCVRAMIEGVNR